MSPSSAGFTAPPLYADSGDESDWIRRLCKSVLEQGLASLYVRLITVRGIVGKDTICPAWSSSGRALPKPRRARTAEPTDRAPTPPHRLCLSRRCHLNPEFGRADGHRIQPDSPGDGRADRPLIRPLQNRARQRQMSPTLGRLDSGKANRLFSRPLRTRDRSGHRSPT